MQTLAAARAPAPTTSVPASCWPWPASSTARPRRSSRFASAWRAWKSASRFRQGLRPRCPPSRMRSLTSWRRIDGRGPRLTRSETPASPAASRTAGPGGPAARPAPGADEPHGRPSPDPRSSNRGRAPGSLRGRRILPIPTVGNARHANGGHGAAADEARERTMARSMWRGAIQFGLVTIPVRLYLATDSKGIAFNMLHASCLNRIQMKTYCPFHEDVISRADTVKGYEYAKDQYVVITDEDLASVPLKTVRSIEIEKFVPARPAEDEPVRFVKQAYYVEPEPIGKKAYALLRDVLAEQGLAAICKVVIKDREVLAALNPHAAAMVLETLHWPDEIRATDELDLPADDVEIKPAERKMAVSYTHLRAHE